MTHLMDPDAVLDFRWDWSAWLDGDTIVAHEVLADGVDVDSSTADTSTVTAWLSGGSVGRSAAATCRITTALGRTDDRTITLIIRQR